MNELTNLDLLGLVLFAVSTHVFIWFLWSRKKGTTVRTANTTQDSRLKEVAQKSDIVMLESKQVADSKITHWGIGLAIAVLVLPYLKQLFT